MNYKPEEIENDADIESENSGSADHIKSSRKPFANLATALTDDELASPGAQKMILAEISRLKSQESHAERFRDKYHTADRERAVQYTPVDSMTTVSTSQAFNQSAMH